ncbi:MAG: glycosyltransferase family 2 protein [Bacteroidales bacterium]|nr:glycosyltransferase family 2 protein [Bacteroidales bacterium]
MNTGNQNTKPMSTAKTTNEKFKDLKICVIIPTYRNAQFLNDVINSVLEQVSDVIVVNDGSPDNTEEILNKYSSQITILNHPKNKGKGQALLTGLKKAYELGFEYAVTMDSDNQHKASDLYKFADEIEKYPNSLIVGARNFEGKDINQSSSFANKFSNFWFTVHTLNKLKDTQTGYRLYPLNKVAKMRLFSSKYETELEMLVRCAWKGIQIKSVDINVFYPPKNERVSSFRPGRDFTRISILNTIFTFVAIFYGYPSMLIHYLVRKIKG